MYHPVGIAVYAAWIFGICYHLLNGIRHLMWDAGKGFTIKQATASGLTVLALTALLSAVIVWVTVEHLPPLVGI